MMSSARCDDSMAISIMGLPNASMISRLTVGFGVTVTSCDCTRWKSKGRGRQMQLLMREHHRLRIAIGAVMLDPVMARAVFAHAATLACGRSPAWMKNLCVSSSERPKAERSQATNSADSGSLAVRVGRVQIGEVESAERPQQRRDIVDRMKSEMFVGALASARKALRAENRWNAD